MSDHHHSSLPVLAPLPLISHPGLSLGESGRLLTTLQLGCAHGVSLPSTGERGVIWTIGSCVQACWNLSRSRRITIWE